MKTILVSTFESFSTLVYSTSFDDEDYSSGLLRLYANKDLNNFLLHVAMDCENQCNREGDSFFSFDNFDELKSFMLSDGDCSKFRGLFSEENDFETNFTVEKFNAMLFGG